MLESPQKNPRMYGVTAFNSHAKKGMDANNMWERRGGEANKKQKKTKDGLMNVCECVFCATWITERQRQQDRDSS